MSTPNMTGAELISDERARQIAVEGWTAEHDDGGESGELTAAATAYLQRARECSFYGEEPRTASPPSVWPWDAKFWKPGTTIRMLTKAGALIAAEIDRRLRAGETT